MNIDLDLIRSILSEDMHPLWKNVDKKLVNFTSEDYLKWLNAGGEQEPEDIIGVKSSLVTFFLFVLSEELVKLHALKVHHDEFVHHYSRLVDFEERRTTILNYAAQLGANSEHVAGDSKAFERWFDFDAVNERLERKISGNHKRMVFCLRRVGSLMNDILAGSDDDQDYSTIWQSFHVDKLMESYVVYDEESRVRAEAFKAIAKALKGIPVEKREGVLGDVIVQHVFRSSLDNRQDVWVQAEALEVLDKIAPSSLVKVLEKRLTNNYGKDDFFLRRRAVTLLAANVGRSPELERLIPKVMQDDNASVRQKMVQLLNFVSEESIRGTLLTFFDEEKDAKVRASAFITIDSLHERESVFPFLLKSFQQGIKHENDGFVIRVALEYALKGYVHLAHVGREKDAEEWYLMVLEEAEAIHNRSQTLSSRRLASQALERLWSEENEEARSLKSNLIPFLEGIKRGKRKKLPEELALKVDSLTFGRVLAVLSREDVGFFVEKTFYGTYIIRGHEFEFRTWRFLHELLNPQPDKREAIRHNIGRKFYGEIHAPSAIMSEMTETRVPGEPLYMPEEGGWRPYLPLLDETLSTLDNWSKQGRKRIFTSEGITEIEAPFSLAERVKAKINITWNFSVLAQLRNWHEQRPYKANRYVEELRKLGFRITFQPHVRDKVDEDPSVKRFFAGFTPFINPDLLAEGKQYFFSVYENSLFELIVFSMGVLLFFVGKNLLNSRKVRKARSQIPLVVGGWGTRGKSGTERLKAAMVNAIGYSIMSKTTGCEAKFIHCYPYGKMREMFIFRPYDKANIWEHFNLILFTARLRVDVFLWECMGLRPTFVKILQRKWSRDHISTITNTYPDHEDVQGPAGYNIPEVMQNFIPHKARLITTEDQMRPILKEGADEQETEMRVVNWLECGLITDDILKRFPHEEHPNNIGLVTALGEELGVDRDFILKEMADRVISDIGVLKTFPVSHLRNRQFEFVNGMSANERFGTLNNWARLGFDQHDPVQEPGTWVCTIVNNRIDRMPRSKDFADMLVRDLKADRHFIVGSNVNGMVSFCQKAFETHYKNLDLWSASESNITPAEQLLRLAQWFRLSTDKEQIQAKLAAMLSGCGLKREDIQHGSVLWDEPEALYSFLMKRDLESLADDILKSTTTIKDQYWEFALLSNELEALGENPTLVEQNAFDQKVRTTAQKWFMSKIIVVEDHVGNGEQVIARICSETPPGYFNRVMGLQNIKGVGLELVYRWMSWETCWHACNEISSNTPEGFSNGLRTLSNFNDFGQLSYELVKKTVNDAIHSPYSQEELLQSEIMMTANKVEMTYEEITGQLTTIQRVNFIVWILEILETFLDIGAAVRRRKKSNQIYEDVIYERIAHFKAVEELQNINTQQHGGWFWKQINSIKKAFGLRHRV